VRKDDGLELDLGGGGITVLAGKHVNLALVHAQLANVRLWEGVVCVGGKGGGCKGGGARKRSVPRVCLRLWFFLSATTH
jgi:hypothetical protein